MTQRHLSATTVHVLLQNDDSLLLLRRHNTGWGDGMYGVPAGHVEKGESVLEAAVREAKEECGVTIDPQNLHFAHVIHQQQRARDLIDRVHFFFTCKIFEGIPTNTEPDACDEVTWRKNETLPTNMLPYITRTLVHIKNGIAYSEFIDS